MTEELSSGPVRVETDEGWVPVDPTLVATAEGVVPAAVPGEVAISGGGTDPLIEVTDSDPDAGSKPVADQTVTVDVAGELPVPVLEGATARYRDALGGSDLVVTASPVGTEVSVVIPDAATAQPSYELDLGVEGLAVSQDANGGLVLRDTAGRQTGYQAAPIIFDSTVSGVPGLAANPGRVSSELVRRDGRLKLVITPEAGYLADPATRFPVTIDPVTDLSPSGDTTVFSGLPNQANDGSTRLYTGANGLAGATRSFIKFNPTTVIEDEMVLSAELKVYQDFAGSCMATPLRAQQATVLSTGATWNNQPALVGSDDRHGQHHWRRDVVSDPGRLEDPRRHGAGSDVGGRRGDVGHGGVVVG